jgi:hypothetical protein
MVRSGGSKDHRTGDKLVRSCVGVGWVAAGTPRIHGTAHGDPHDLGHVASGISRSGSPLPPHKQRLPANFDHRANRPIVEQQDGAKGRRRRGLMVGRGHASSLAAKTFHESRRTQNVGVIVGEPSCSQALGRQSLFAIAGRWYGYSALLGRSVWPFVIMSHLPCQGPKRSHGVLLYPSRGVPHPRQQQRQRRLSRR